MHFYAQQIWTVRTCIYILRGHTILLITASEIWLSSALSANLLILSLHFLLLGVFKWRLHSNSECHKNKNLIPRTGVASNCIDDVIKDWKSKRKNTINTFVLLCKCIKDECIKVKSTFARNVKNRSVLSSVITQHSFVNTMILSGEL